MARITKLKLMNGRTLCEWYLGRSSTFEDRQNIWAEARLEIAEWADCPLSRVGEIESECGGEFFTVDDEPVAFLVRVDPPHRTLTVDLRPMLAAE